MSEWRVRNICGLLVALHLAIGLLAASLVEVGRVTPASFFFAMVVASQLCLLGMWAGLAWRRTLRSAFACAAGGLNWRGFRKLPSDAGATTFSFRCGNSCCSCLPTVLSSGLVERSANFFSQGADEHSVAAFYSVFIAVFSVIVLLGMLTPGRLGLNSLGLPFLVLGLTYVLNLLIHCRSREFVATALFAGGASCIVMATLMPVRLAGYLTPTQYLRQSYRRRDATGAV